MEKAIQISYYFILFIIVTFSLCQFCLLLLYGISQRKRRPLSTTPIPWHKLPRVTIQLPIYNELYVIDRLIDTVLKLQYPADKFDIQILDDSTDETTARIARKIAGYRQSGLSIAHIRRPERTGFKAGALAYGLKLAQGEFIAIFDADFLPDPDFLLRTLPSFDQPNVCVVQTRWLHINEDYSLLTTVQAIALNAHFILEQNARYRSGLFLNFNGTAGIWRKAAILDAGGWQADTLTEDLDLSYRAQLKGWTIVYRDDVGVPAELPVTMNAMRSQQYRWMKGPAECARKLLKQVITAPGVSIGKKIQAGFHLLNSSLFLLTLAMALLSVPVLYYGGLRATGLLPVWTLDGLSLVAFVPLLFWGTPFVINELDRTEKEMAESGVSTVTRILRFLWLYPSFVSVMMGLSLHNSLAVLEGHLGIKTPFVRTPKFNVSASTDSWTANVYTKSSFSGLVFLEILLALYFGAGLILGIYRHDYSMLGFHGLLAAGYSIVVGYSLAHARTTSRASISPVMATTV